MQDSINQSDLVQVPFVLVAVTMALIFRLRRVISSAPRYGNIFIGRMHECNNGRQSTCKYLQSRTAR